MLNDAQLVALLVAERHKELQQESRGNFSRYTARGRSRHQRTDQPSGNRGWFTSR